MMSPPSQLMMGVGAKNGEQAAAGSRALVVACSAHELIGLERGLRCAQYDRYTLQV